MPYRLLALDLDGTTVVGGQLPTAIGRRVVEAIAAATARGVQVVVATGRPYVSARRYAAALGLCTPAPLRGGQALICFQGALVKECGGAERTLFAEAVPHAPFAEVVAFAQARGAELNIYTEDRIYHGPTDHSPEFYDMWFGMTAQPVTSLEDAYEALRAQARPVFKGLFIGEAGDTDRLTIDLQEMVGGPAQRDLPLERSRVPTFARFNPQGASPRLTVMRSHPLFVEVTSPNVSKGNAVAFLAKRWGIPRSQTIAVGDSGNDVSMVAWAGLGVAVANATPDVLAAADWVAPPVTEDGVVAVIEQYILNAERPWAGIQNAE